MEHQCVIGIWNDYDYSPLITMNELLKLQPNTIYTMKQYCDWRYSTNLTRFSHCPYCGKKINWKKNMNNFFFVYIIIGFLFYTIILSLIYHIGIDNIKNVTDDEDIKNLNFESFSTNIILLILCVFLWPIILLYVLLNNN